MRLYVASIGTTGYMPMSQVWDFVSPKSAWMYLRGEALEWAESPDEVKSLIPRFGAMQEFNQEGTIYIAGTYYEVQQQEEDEDNE